MKAQYIYVELVKLTWKRRAKHKQYNIITYSVTQIRFLTEIFFSFLTRLKLLQRVTFVRHALVRYSSSCFQIKLAFILFSFLFLYKLVCADAEITLFVYYKNDLFCVL